MDLSYIDLFCGIGGFRFAADLVARERGLSLTCKFSCDIDPTCRDAYAANFGERPHGDIRSVKAKDIPFHDLLFAGFPCQPFSIIGGLRGFQDTRGTLFFEIARILEAKRPRAFILENVKQLVSHDRGHTLSRIKEALHDLGYVVTSNVLDARDFGLPQKRERIFIVGFSETTDFIWPQGGEAMVPLRELLEPNPAPFYYASERIRAARAQWHQPDEEPTIWHENKAGNVSKYPYSCALRAGASYNYLLVDGIRRLTEREMLRLQGFPESYKIVNTYAEVRRHAGNAVPVPVVASVLHRVLDSIGVPYAGTLLGNSQVEMVFEKTIV